MVSLMVGYVQFAVSILSLLPSGVFISLDSASILSMQVSKYFSVTILIFLLAFCLIVFIASTALLEILQFYCLKFVQFIARNLFNCFACVCLNCFDQNFQLFCFAIILLFASFSSKIISWYFWLSYSLPFCFLCVFILSL